MKILRTVGVTSQILQIFIRSTASGVGAGLTGLTNATANLIAYFHRDTDTTATAISLQSMTAGTFTSSGFVEIDATHMPGWYQFCPPNTVFATGAESVALHLQGALNMVALPIEIDLHPQTDIQRVNNNATDAAQLALGASQIITGTAVTGTLSSTAMSCSGNAAASTDSLWVGRTVIWTSGVLSGSQATISAYNHTTTVITYSTTATGASPSNGDTFIIV